MTKEHLQSFVMEKEQGQFFGNTGTFEVPVSHLVATVRDLRDKKHLQLKFVTATDEREESGCFKIWYVFGSPTAHVFIVTFIRVKEAETFPSIASEFHEAWNDERKIKTFFGLTPVGHPDERPLVLHENWPADVFPLRKDVDGQARPKIANGSYAFQMVGGEGMYEIPVGPIHAGIIEPGHFRFSVAGEEIVLLEPRLGYVHKGTEKLFESLPLEEKIVLSEKISGDSSFSHSLAFCQALEQLSESVVPRRALHLRVIFAELERLANHFGDIGAMMLDAGFNFGGAHGARLREIVMRIHERLTGSRFLRGVNACGGVNKDIGKEEQARMLADLARLSEDFEEVMEIANHSASLLNRLKGTGTISLETAQEHGAVGVAARAVGMQTDTRVDYPYAAYEELSFNAIETETSGDASARFYVRVKEVRASLELIKRALQTLPDGEIRAEKTGPFKKNAVVISVVEGWRGEILSFVKTDGNGTIERGAPRDPSWINWRLLSHAGARNVVPDFPIINKSFNLSYTGNDL